MIWTKDKISIADELMSLVPKLRDEFLDYHKDFDTTFSKGISYAAANPLTILNEQEKTSWKVEGIRYVCKPQNVEQNLFLDPKISSAFPTATELTKKYINYCVDIQSFIVTLKRFEFCNSFLVSRYLF